MTGDAQCVHASTGLAGAAGGTGDAHPGHGVGAQCVHAWDAVRARMRARVTGADPLSAPRRPAGPGPGPVTPGTVPAAALGDVAPRAGCQHAGGCPHRVPCVGPCHASTVAGRATGPTNRKRGPAPTITNRRQDAPDASDPSADAWTAAVAAPGWLAELLRADAARPGPVPPPAVPPPAFRSPLPAELRQRAHTGHRADACPDVAEHIRAELRRAYRAERDRVILGAPGAPVRPLVGILPGPAPATLTPCTPRPGTMPTSGPALPPDGPLTSTNTPPAADSRPIHTEPDHQAEHQAARVRAALAELAEPTGPRGGARYPGAAPDAPPVAALSGPPPGWTTHTGPGALTATYRAPSPAQRARIATDAARAAAARARTDLADACPVRPWAACVPDGADPATCRAQCAELADRLGPLTRPAPDRAACPRHGYPHALPCPHDPQEAPPVPTHDHTAPVCPACGTPSARHPADRGHASPPAPTGALPRVPSGPAPGMPGPAWTPPRGEIHAPGCPGPHPLGTLCHGTRPRAQHGAPLSAPRSAMSAPARPVTPGDPQEAPQEAPAGQDGPRPLPGEPMPCSVGPGCPVCADRAARYGTPAGPPDEAPQDGPQDERPAWVAATAAALGADPARALAALPQDGPQDAPRCTCTPPGRRPAIEHAPGCPRRAPRRPLADFAPTVGEFLDDGPRPAPPQDGPRITLTAGRLYVAPLGTATPYEAPEPCAMAPYAPPGPDDAALGNPWRDVGILAGPLPTGPQEPPQDAPRPPTWPGSTGAALTWVSDALRDAFRGIGVDLDHVAAQRARQDEARAWRRGHMRDLRTRARYRAARRPLPADLDPQGA